MKLFGTKFVQAALQLENIFRNRLFPPENQQTTNQSLMKVNGNGRYGVFGAPHDLIIWTLKSPFGVRKSSLLYPSSCGTFPTSIYGHLGGALSLVNNNQNHCSTT